MRIICALFSPPRLHEHTSAVKYLLRAGENKFQAEVFESSFFFLPRRGVLWNAGGLKLIMDLGNVSFRRFLIWFFKFFINFKNICKILRSYILHYNNLINSRNFLLIIRRNEVVSF